jgi:hypothetical protein
MGEEIIIRPMEASEPKQLPKFMIKVKNKFDEDKRNIRVCHMVNGKPESCDTLYYLKGEEQQRQEQSPPLHEKIYFLGPRDSLVVEIKMVIVDDEVYDQFKKDVYIEVPFVADYKLFWEIEQGKERRLVDRPIKHILRDTSPPRHGERKPVEDAKTIIVIPRDQNAFKLEIKSPRNLWEHYHPAYLLADYLNNTGGTPDNVSIGDNGPG